MNLVNVEMGSLGNFIWRLFPIEIKLGGFFFLLNILRWVSRVWFLGYTYGNRAHLRAEHVALEFGRPKV